MPSTIFISMFLSIALMSMSLFIPIIYIIFSIFGYYSLLILLPFLYYKYCHQISLKKENGVTETFVNLSTKITQEEYDVAEILANLSNTKNIKEEKIPKLRRSERIKNKEIGKNAIFY